MWDDWGRFKPSKPRDAKGGIKAQSKQGKFGESWWAKRWISVLEGFNIGARLGRGKTYARKGQVLDIQVDKGVVKAKVQGSRPTPYAVTIRINPIETADWNRLAKDLAKQAIFAAKLLSGEMPNDIEQAFKDANLSLFPTKFNDLKTACSCPDSSNPCKHIAAVYYLLGEEFDRDPFLIFTLRGLTRDDLITLLGRSGAKAATADPQETPLPHEPLSTNLQAYWGQPPSSDEDTVVEVEPPPVTAALPRRLGSFPFWRGQQPFLQALEPTYARATPRGLDTVLGQNTTEPAEDSPKPKKPRATPKRRNH
jgi:uncharacterized Zn finger protein